MIQNRVLKFDNFLIGGIFERLDTDNPEEAQIWADHDLAILVAMLYSLKKKTNFLLCNFNLLTIIINFIYYNQFYYRFSIPL